jgi:hypothetical protein
MCGGSSSVRRSPSQSPPRTQPPAHRDPPRTEQTPPAARPRPLFDRDVHECGRAQRRPLKAKPEAHERAAPRGAKNPWKDLMRMLKELVRPQAPTKTAPPASAPPASAPPASAPPAAAPPVAVTEPVTSPRAPALPPPAAVPFAYPV